MPISPGDGSIPFLSAPTSRAATAASLYEKSRERRSSTGLDGEGCAVTVVDADVEDSTGLGGRLPSLTGRCIPLAPYAERPARSLNRKGRSTFGCIAEE